MWSRRAKREERTNRWRKGKAANEDKVRQAEETAALVVGSRLDVDVGEEEDREEDRDDVPSGEDETAGEEESASEGKGRKTKRT